MRKVHGHAWPITSGEYRAWLGAKQRCYDPNTKNFDRYGGRGIRVCDRWLYYFATFLEDMGLKPEAGYSLDRKDNDGDYAPENCRWATKHQQDNNRSSNRLLTFRGETMSISDWAIRLGIKRKTLTERLRLGWSTEETLTTPIRLRSDFHTK